MGKNNSQNEGNVGEERKIRVKKKFFGNI